MFPLNMVIFHCYVKLPEGITVCFSPIYEHFQLSTWDDDEETEAAGSASEQPEVLYSELSDLTIWMVNVDAYPLVNQHNYGKSQFFMDKSTISMVIFNIAMFVYQRVNADFTIINHGEHQKFHH